MKITLFFRWYYIWVGAYVDKVRRSVYICLVPMVGIKVTIPEKHYAIVGGYSGMDIGCCPASGRADVLVEEPRASFRLVKEKDCPNCREYRER